MFDLEPWTLNLKADIPEEAQAAWQAYVAMSESKKGYFSFLQALDEKYKHCGSPSIAENLKLEELLGVHDKNVLAFNEAMSAINDTEARNALLQALGASNVALGMN